MIDPPSKQLQQLLMDLQLCNPRDIRRCRPRVRRLAHDLPAFDSVWIDALVQGRYLTAFQAKLLESPQPDRLCIGSCVLVDRIGMGPTTETYLARCIDSNSLCVLKVHQLCPEMLRESTARI